MTWMILYSTRPYIIYIYIFICLYYIIRLCIVLCNIGGGGVWGQEMQQELRKSQVVALRFVRYPQMFAVEPGARCPPLNDQRLVYVIILHG